ncbi:VOC family protein [Nocardia sp. NPDC050378]|uniref:VOC family protein n=1 Tax=Nocardia sp. NPDC050378 TaxID=3155400 RepID=UPI0033CDA792
MKAQGITWHAVVVQPDQFEAHKAFTIERLGIAPMMEADGTAVFSLPNGDLYEIYTPATTPPYGYNDSFAIGFRVDDIAQASQELADNGFELLGDINRAPEYQYAYRHFRGPDGRVYGINESKPQPTDPS